MRFGKPSPAMIVALIALLFSLGGTGAYATHLTVFSDDIVDGEVKSPDLADGAVTTFKVAPDSIGSSRIADGRILSADIQDGTLKGKDVADNSLTGADIDESTLTLPTAGFASGGPAPPPTAESTVQSLNVTTPASGKLAWTPPPLTPQAAVFTSALPSSQV